MASGDTLLVFTPHQADLPAANFATFDRRNRHLVLDFDAATDETLYFESVLPRHYAGGGITARLCWMAATAVANEVVWSMAFERHQDDAFDLDGDGFAGEQTVTPTAPNVSGEVSYDDITFTNGAQIDGLLVGEHFRIRLFRDANNVNDDMAGDAELLSIELRET